MHDHPATMAPRAAAAAAIPAGGLVKALGRLFAFALWFFYQGPAMGDIYFRNEDGVPAFSDQPGGEGFRLFLRTDDLPRLSPARHVNPALGLDRMRNLSPLVRAVASQYRLEPALLHAVIMVESAYDPQAVSAKGAVGLMQLMPHTARRYGVTDRQDARQSLDGGARYLAWLIGQFGNDLRLALAAYNAGENAVRRWGGDIPPYAETRRYVAAVLARYHSLRNQRDL